MSQCWDSRRLAGLSLTCRAAPGERRVHIEAFPPPTSASYPQTPLARVHLGGAD